MQQNCPFKQILHYKTWQIISIFLKFATSFKFSLFRACGVQLRPDKYCTISFPDALNVLMLSKLVTGFENIFDNESVVIQRAGKSYWGGRLNTIDLLLLTSLDQLIFMLKILFQFFYKTSYLNEEVNCTEPSPSVSIPCKGRKALCYGSCSLQY
jgi:hypothetical protein